MFAEAVSKEPHLLEYLPDHLKTGDVCSGSKKRAMVFNICTIPF